MTQAEQKHMFSSSLATARTAAVMHTFLKWRTLLSTNPNKPRVYAASCSRWYSRCAPHTPQTPLVPPSTVRACNMFHKNVQNKYPISCHRTLGMLHTLRMLRNQLVTLSITIMHSKGTLNKPQ